MKIPETTEEQPHILVQLTDDLKIILTKTTRPCMYYKDYNTYSGYYETVCHRKNVNSCVRYLIHEKEKSINKQIKKLTSKLNQIKNLKNKL
jgi:hypothetical protein